MSTMKKMSIVQLILILATSALLSACEKSGKVQADSGVTVSGVSIETVRLESSLVVYEAVGTIRSADTSILAAQLGGTVREVRVKAGDRVKRGQLLALLDDRNPRAQLEVAQAGVNEAAQGLAEVAQALQAATAERQFAEATYKRYQGLLAKNSVSRQEFDGAEVRYKAALASERALEAKQQQVRARSQQAQSQQESAQTFFSYSRVTSPLDGIVTGKSVDAGTVVMPGAPLLTVEDTSRYRLEASLPEQLLSKVVIGETVSVTTDGNKLEGRVVEVAPSADAASRTFLVKVELSRDCACRSGLYGKASFPVGEEKRLAVPRQAVVERGELDGLFVVNAQGTAEYRLVKTGKEFDERVEILSGLAEGERVATSRVERLKDGARVEGL
jgi:multidrug efflux pump subunit AcrA (membrane-fusion protein)